MRLLMRCDHVIDVDPNKCAAPACWCGEAIVARPLDAPAPRIVGHARGPHVDSTFLGPIDVAGAMRPADNRDAIATQKDTD